MNAKPHLQTSSGLYYRLKSTNFSAKTAFLVLLFTSLITQVSAQTFYDINGPTNPFGVYRSYENDRIDLVDIDGDGDLDFFSCVESSGNIRFMRNTGTKYKAVYTELYNADNPFDKLSFGREPTIRFVDIDGDGDKDAFINIFGGDIAYFENTGTITNPLFTERTGNANPLSFVDMGYMRSVSAFVDIDNDGDMDVFIGNNDGKIRCFQNTGTNTAPVFAEKSASANPLYSFGVLAWAAPAFGDFDNDGDMDAIVGCLNNTLNIYEYLYYFENVGTATNPVFEARKGTANPFNKMEISLTIPVIADINGDGDLDVIAPGTGIRFISNGPIEPGPPTAVRAGEDVESAWVSFSDPTSDGGSPITSYTATSYPEGITATGTKSPITVTGLTGVTGYRFSVTATNALGTSMASDQSNTVFPIPRNLDPTDIILSASSLNENSPYNSVVGTLSTTDPNTDDFFNYTLVTGTGSTDNAVFNISDNSLRISQIPDYERKNSYSIRIRTTDQEGLWFEKVFSITINNVIEAPVATTQAATAITSNSVTLNGNVNANSLSSVITFEYGTTTVYGSTATANQSPVTGTTAKVVSVSLSNLAQNTTYHFRVKAQNSDGTAYGEDLTFTTLKAPPAIPTIISLSKYADVIGASITITGTNFSTIIAEQEVYVGAVKATITAATETSITFTIPEGALTGKVKVVLNNGEEAISANNLVILGAPSFTSTAITTTPYGQLYNYPLSATNEGDLTTTITATTKPAWLNLKDEGTFGPQKFGSIPGGTMIYGMATDFNGNTYAIKSDGTEIFKISPNGATTVWKSELSNNQVNDLYISNGYLYIPRVGDNQQSITRIPLSNPEAAEEQFASISTGAYTLTAKDGWIYASNYYGAEIVRINETTKIKETILNYSRGIPYAGPTGICFDNEGNLFIASSQQKKILKYNGSVLSTVLTDLPSLPLGLECDKQGNFYVAIYNSGLRKYKPDFSSYELVSTTAYDMIYGLNTNEKGDIYYSNPGSGVYRLETGTQLSGTPSKSDIGQHNVVLRASNSAGYTEQTFTINVVDNTAPVTHTFSPANNATGVDSRPTLKITFDEEVNLGTTGIMSIYNASTLVKSYDLSVPADKALFTLSADKLTISITLTEDLPSNTLISIGISEGFVKDLSNNNFAGFAYNSGRWRFTALKKTEQTIIFPEISTKTYGDASFTLGGSTTDKGLTVTYTAQDPSIVRISDNLAIILKAGTTKITATQPGDANYAAATTVERILTVNKAPLTIKADQKSKEYGDTDPAFTAQVITGTVVSGDVATGTLTRVPGESAADYAISKGTYTFGDNYTETFVTANLTITKRPVSVTAVAETKTYNGNTNSDNMPTVGALVNGDIINNSPVQVYDNANAGSNHVLTASGLTIKNISGADMTNNYNISYIPSAATGVILPKQLSITDPVVVLNKIYDGNTSATISTIGNLQGVEANDQTNVSVTAEATYNSAEIGSDKVITVRYTLTGSAAGNYLAPANYEITNAKIEQDTSTIILSPLTNPIGDCEATALDLEYTILNGLPTEYKLTFSQEAIDAGMVNVAYTDLPANTGNGTIRFDISAVKKGGTYQGSLVMSNGKGVESAVYNFNFTINVSANLIMHKFKNVIFVDNKVNKAVGFQWYKNGTEITGATKQFYADPDGLVGIYMVRLTTTTGNYVYSCEKTFNIPLSKKVQAYPNPVKKGQGCRVDALGFSEKDFENAQLTIYNAQGMKVYELAKVDINNTIHLPEMPGVYVGQFKTTAGETHVFKIIVSE
jgi:hypothetical protein